MVQSLQASEMSLYDVEKKLQLKEVNDDQFFWEWHQNLPELTDAEKEMLDRVKADFHDQQRYPMLEQSIKMVAVSPLLSLAGFYRAPFRIRPEKAINIALEDQEAILRGRIDVLVLAEQLWVLVIESKEAGFSLKEAIPQALVYMAAQPNVDRPAYGLCTNGSHWLFLKLDAQKQYSLSEEFSLQRRKNELHEVLQVLKQLGQLIRPS
jgi:hypothetical protein